MAPFIWAAAQFQYINEDVIKERDAAIGRSNIFITFIETNCMRFILAAIMKNGKIYKKPE